MKNRYLDDHSPYPKQLRDFCAPDGDLMDDRMELTVTAGDLRKIADTMDRMYAVIGEMTVKRGARTFID